MKNTRKFVRSIATMLVTASAVALSSGAASAQEAENPQVVQDEDVPGVIIVTATRREQALSQVPSAISSYVGSDLQERGITDVQDLSQVSSSLNITTGPSELAGTEIRFRGVGTAGGGNPGLEPSVGIFVDGVYRSRTGLAVGDLLDIGSVELLRGPQGTLFGRNTSAGTLNINTLKPSFDTGGYISAEIQNYSGYFLSAGLTGPVAGDNLAFRLAVSHNKRDGYVIDRLVPSRDIYNRNRTSVRGQLLWNPTENVDVRLILDYQQKDESCCAPDYLIRGPTAPAIEALGGIVQTNPFEYRAQQSFEPLDKLDEGGVSIETNWTLGDGLDLTWVGAYRKADAYTTQDPDSNSVDIVQGTDWNQNNEFLSQELRLKGVSGRLDWLVGAYYFEDKFDVDWQITYGAQFGSYFNLLTGLPAFLFPTGAADASRFFEQKSNGWALFTHNIVELNDTLDLVLGFRWSEEKKDARTVITNTAIHCALVPAVPFCPVPGFARKRTESEPSGTIKLVRNLDVGNIYIGYSRGYKSGGFNLDRDAVLTSLQFAPEIVDTFEAGVKWSSQDQKFNVSADLFYSIFRDYQINQFNGVGFATTNAAKVESSGLELAATWRPLKGLLIDGGLTWTNTKFTKNPNVNDAGEPLEGRQLPFSPKLAMTGSVSYKRPIGSLMGFGNINASYLGRRNIDTNLSSRANIGASTIVNARLGLSSQNEDWEVSIWAKNMFKEEVSTIVFPGPLQTGSFITYRNEPRMYGIGAKFKF